MLLPVEHQLGEATVVVGDDLDTRADVLVTDRIWKYHVTVFSGEPGPRPCGRGLKCPQLLAGWLPLLVLRVVGLKAA